MKKTLTLLAAACALTTFAGCSNMPAGMQNLPVIGKAQGSGAAGATSTGKPMTAQTCASPLGTVAIEQDTSQNWFSILTTQYQLPSLIPVIRLLVQQSNCFVVVDRTAGLQQGLQERQLANSGLLRGNSNYHNGQIVSADYTLEPSVTFTNNSMAGVAGLVGAFIPGASMIAANVNMKEAQASLNMVDNRSSVQVAAATGAGKGFDFMGMDAGTIGGKYGSLGAYASTAQGKVVLSAFIDAYNNLIDSVRQYKQQNVQGGMGTGGHLNVQGSDSGSAAPTAAPMAQTGQAMPVRVAQMDLNMLGYNVGHPDGAMGPHTRAELRKFQAASHLQATGELDVSTIAALRTQTAR